MEMIKRDWYGPGLYDDVDQWVGKCIKCKSEKGVASQSAWTRTEIYSRPFRVIQFETVKATPTDKQRPITITC